MNKGVGKNQKVSSDAFKTEIRVYSISGGLGLDWIGDFTTGEPATEPAMR
jgi:hypothetical protein